MADEKKSPQIENSTEITLKEFAGLVKQMRFNQRRYFRMRKPEILETCKALERKVDDTVAKIFDGQLNLF